MALNETVCTTGGSTCHVLSQGIESLRAGITPFGKSQASQSCKIAAVQSFQTSRWFVEEFGNSVEPILEKLCEYESFDEATPRRKKRTSGSGSARSHAAEDLYQVFRVSPGHQRMWRSSEAWLRSQPGVAATGPPPRGLGLLAHGVGS